MYDLFKVTTKEAHWRQKKVRRDKKGWDGIQRLMTLSGRLPMGLLPRLYKFLGPSVTITRDFEDFDRKHDIGDIRDFLREEILLLKKRMGYEPYDYQKKVLANNIIKGRALTLSATSSGKSYMMYLFTKFRLREQSLKTLIIVPTITLADQVGSDFLEFSGNEWDGMIHTIYQGQRKDTNCPIVVSTWQSLQDQDPEWFLQFDTLIVDEVHGMRAPEMVNLVHKCGHIVYRMGLTGTLDGSETHSQQCEAYFGEIFEAINTREMIDRGIATPAEVQILIFDYPDPEANRRFVKQSDDFIKQYQNECSLIDGCAFRNAFIANLAQHKTGRGENTLILFKSVEHGKLLHSLLPGSRLIYGNIKREERLRIKEEMKTTEGLVLVASYGTFSTGESIPRIHNIIAAGNYKGRIKVLQSIGRGLRLHSSKALVRIYDLADNLYEGCMNLKQLKERISMYMAEDIGFPYKITPVNVKSGS